MNRRRIGAGVTSRSALPTLVVVAVILLLTLWPLGARPAFDDDRLTVRFGLADVLRNLLLFLPFGWAQARRRTGLLGIALRAALLSGAIELAQVIIPGRYGNVSDLLSNAAGALVGAALQRRARGWLAPSPRAASRFAVAWAVALCGLVFGTGWLLGPALPRALYFSGRTPDLGHLARYDGEVTSAALGDVPLGNGPIEASANVRRLWLDGAPLRAELRAGGPAASLAPIVTLHDGLRREILLLGAERGDLVLRVRTRAQAVSLDRPALRWPGILDGVRAGERVELTARRVGNGYCLSMGDQSACPLGFTAGSGWRLIWFPHLLPTELAPWLNGVWLGLLFVPLGVWLRATPAGGLAVALGMGSLFAAPFAGLLATPTFELVWAGAGLAVGGLARPLFGRPNAGARLDAGARALYS